MESEAVLHMHNCLMISLGWSDIIKTAFNQKYKQEFVFVNMYLLHDGDMEIFILTTIH